jgi:diguanylate cyclase (GGDEF)-like protein
MDPTLATGAAADVSADPQLSGALLQLLSAQAERQGAPVAVKDALSGRYLHANAAMAGVVGAPLAAVCGATDAELFAPIVATALRAADQTALSQREPLVSDHRFEHHGLRHEFSVLRLVSRRADGSRPLVCSVWTNEAPARRKEEQLRQTLDQLEQQQRAVEAMRRELKDQGLRDEVSGLYSRSHFDDQLRREVDLSTREHREFALVLVEVDPFPDDLAALGERLLARIQASMGQLLRGNTRAMDASCRIDGSRFAVLLSGVGLATAHARMEGLRRQCATQIVVLDARDLRFTVSMGVASFPHTAHTQEEVFTACENALAEARRRGGNHVTLASIRFDGG